MPTFAEFFAGIGLVRMGLERHEWEVAFANDHDPLKYEMYKSQFLNAQQHFLLGDIHNIGADQVPTVTMATASFPCTDLSLAGGRAGLDGKHSGTFWSFIRILDEMGERRPPLVLLENVLGFLSSHDGNDFQAALQALNTLGYSVDSFVIDAVHFVPQSRQRLFILGTRNNPCPRQGNISVSEVRPKELVQFMLHHPELHWHVCTLPPLPKSRRTFSSILEDLPDTSPEWWSAARADYLLSQMSTRHRVIADYLIRGHTWSYGTVFRRTRNGKCTAELRADGIAGCLRTPRGGSAKQIVLKAGYGRYFARWLTPRECARLMGADNYPITLSPDQALFGFGDAVCVPVIEWIAQQYLQAIVQELAQEQSVLIA